MYKPTKQTKTSLNVNTSYIGETIEQKIRRIVNNKEPITDGAPLIYTDRKEGVQPGYNIRTDRFEVAVEAMDKVTKSHLAKRENKASLGQKAKEGMEAEKDQKTDKKTDDGVKPIQTTEK